MYKFEKINEDTYKLITDTKEFTFTRTVDIAKEMQSIDMYATYRVAEFLAERGETFDNTKLRVERHEGNKTIVDESGLEAVKKEARNMAYYDAMDQIFKKSFGKGYLETIVDIGLNPNNQDEVRKFAEKLAEILANGMSDNTPSGSN